MSSMMDHGAFSRLIRSTRCAAVSFGAVVSVIVVPNLGMGMHAMYLVRLSVQYELRVDEDVRRQRRRHRAILSKGEVDRTRRMLGVDTCTVDADLEPRAEHAPRSTPPAFGVDHDVEARHRRPPLREIVDDLGASARGQGAEERV